MPGAQTKKGPQRALFVLNPKSLGQPGLNRVKTVPACVRPYAAGLDIQAQRDTLTVGLAVNGFKGGDSHGLNGTLSLGVAF